MILLAFAAAHAQVTDRAATYQSQTTATQAQTRVETTQEQSVQEAVVPAAQSPAQVQRPVDQVPPSAAHPAAQQVPQPATNLGVEGNAAAQAPAVNVNAEVIRGRELLRTGEATKATTVLENARAQAVKSGAKNEEASALFYLGVAQQARIQTGQLPENEKLAARAAAISAYEQALAVNATSGPALNNLAQLYRTDPAKHAQADQLLAKAIALNDSRQGVYLLNRAALKRETGDLPGALKLAEQAAKADRANLEAHAMVVDVALAGENATPLLAYLQELNESGLVARALDAAASGLEKFSADRAKLLVSIGASLSNPAYTAWPPRFTNTEAGRKVQQFSNDPSIGTGVRELVTMLQKPIPAQSISWWQRRGSDNQGIPPASPATMQNLTRRCADIYRSAGDPGNLKLAEAYYRMAIDLSEPRTDPRSFVALADILFNRDGVDGITQLLNRYEWQLYESKGDAIARSDYRQTFELRLALGMMYGYTKRWVNPQKQYASAIWMLENAERSARDYNRGVPITEQITLPPEAVKMLSKGYSETGNASRSVTVRLEAADRYLAANQPERAAEVLDESWRSSLPANLDPTLNQRLQSTLTKIQDAS